MSKKGLAKAEFLVLLYPRPKGRGNCFTGLKSFAWAGPIQDAGGCHAAEAPNGVFIDWILKIRCPLSFMHFVRLLCRSHAQGRSLLLAMTFVILNVILSFKWYVNFNHVPEKIKPLIEGLYPLCFRLSTIVLTSQI